MERAYVLREGMADQVTVCCPCSTRMAVSLEQWRARAVVRCTGCGRLISATVGLPVETDQQRQQRLASEARWFGRGRVPDAQAYPSV